jgi:hypothetical protein
MVGSYTYIYRSDACLLIPGIVLCIALVQQDIFGKRVKEVLLGLQRIFLGRITAIGTVDEPIGQFVLCGSSLLTL